ncbi:DUF3558 domain-containing protein [Nocardia spumae]|uniref:DUF3558 domain-containing protein n=1 Tax=Nocardia spumae TaxID=2887190 RepID=UPI001D135151
MRRAITLGAAATLTAGVLAACSSGESGTATTVASHTVAATTTAQVATSAQVSSWKPCEIPDSDISAVGLNPATKQEDGPGEVKFPGVDICAWLGQKSNWYQLNVYSDHSHSYDEVVHNTRLYKDPEPITVDGRPGTRLVSATSDHDCTIAVDAKNPVQFQVSAKLSAEQPGDACAEATRIATALAKHVPN